MDRRAFEEIAQKVFDALPEPFREAIDNIASRDESYWGAKYDLACAYEKNGDVKEAFEIFSEIYGIDSKFRQVSEKLGSIKAILPKEETEVKETEVKKKSRVSYI